MSTTLVSHLECSTCGKRFDPSKLNTVCDVCAKPILTRYALKPLDRAALLSREPTMWRYRELLPLRGEPVSLGETMTPLIRARALARVFDLDEVWIKDESRLPTGTFKARGLAMAVSKAAEFGVKRVAIPSAGNAAEAAAVYAARAFMECFVFVPKDAPVASIRTCQAAGAKVFLVDGLISDCGKIVRDGAKECGWFDLSTFREPYRIEGKKTMGFEVAEQMGWTLPDVIVYPTGGGTGLVGMWKAFDEMERIGFMPRGAKRPKMVSVQAANCAPIVRAFHQGADKAEPWQHASTIADGLRVPKAIGDFLVLRAVRESGGAAIAVSDEDMVLAMKEMGALEGISAAPEGGAALHALKVLIDQGRVRPTDTVVVFNTGGALKYLDVLG